MAAVDGMGVVHEYVRFSTTWEAFLDHFKDADGKINGCVITRVATPSAYGPRNRQEREHQFLIRFYYGLKDDTATELDFQELIEAACTALSADGDLGGWTHAAGPPQVKVVEPRLFGKVLCHYGEIELPVAEEAALTQ